MPYADAAVGLPWVKGRATVWLVSSAATLLSLAFALAGCDSGLSPCARSTGAVGEQAVELWIDCKNEEAGQLIEVQVTSTEQAGQDASADTAAVDAAAGADAGAADEPTVWWVQNPVNDATDYFFVEYGVLPRGWDERRAPQPLRPGARYRAALTTSDYGTLEFDFVAP